MTGVPSVFGFSQIALTALIAFAASLIVLWVSVRHKNLYSWAEILTIAGVVGCSVLFWRLAGNAPQLNDDPIPPISPNDALCPIVTYIFLGLYAGFHPPNDLAHWERSRAWLTVISFVVNVVFI